MAKKRIGIIAGLILMGIFLLAMGPFDVFTHGFYPNEIDVAQIADADKLGQIKVNAQDSVIVFSPQEKHFAGVIALVLLGLLCWQLFKPYKESQKLTVR